MSEADGKNGKYVVNPGGPIYTTDYSTNESGVQVVSGYTPETKTWVPTPGTTEADGTYNEMKLDGSEHQASNALADYTRANFANMVEKYYPKMDDLMNMTTYMNKGLAPTEVNKATGLVGQAFDTVAAGQNRNISRLGMTQTAEQKTASASALDLGRSLATADASNNTRLMLQDRDRSIASGGFGTATAIK